MHTFGFIYIYSSLKSKRLSAVCKDRLPTCIIVHSASINYHYSSSSKTLYILQLTPKDKQTELLTCIPELVLRKESHMKPLHSL